MRANRPSGTRRGGIFCTPEKCGNDPNINRVRDPSTASQIGSATADAKPAASLQAGGPGFDSPVSPPRPEALSVHREGPLSCPSSSKVRQRVSQDPLSELVAEALERLNQTPNDLGAALASQSESIPDGELSQSR